MDVSDAIEGSGGKLADLNAPQHANAASVSNGTQSKLTSRTPENSMERIQELEKALEASKRENILLRPTHPISQAQPFSILAFLPNLNAYCP